MTGKGIDVSLIMEDLNPVARKAMIEECLGMAYKTETFEGMVYGLPKLKWGDGICQDVLQEKNIKRLSVRDKYDELPNETLHMFQGWTQ